MLVRTSVIATALWTLAAVGAAPPVAAAQPTIVTQAVDRTFLSRNWTRRCKFPVYIHESGTLTSKLFFSADGSTVITEIDTAPNLKTVYFSPREVPGGTGGSYSSPAAVALRTTYPSGVYLGAPATLYFNGLQVLAPGRPQEAGHDVWLGEVVDIIDGVPVADLVEPLSSSGNFSEFAAIVAAICGAIAAP